MGKSQKSNLIRRAKVIATIGPACNDYHGLKTMIENGMDIARINTSHAGEKEVTEVVGHIRDISKKLNSNTAILLDLQGPKIRIGKLKQDLVIKSGDYLNFTPKETDGTYDADKGIVLSVSYPNLIKDLHKGNTIFIDDGLIECRVVEISSRDSMARCEVIRGGVVRSHKGINLPGIRLSIESVTEKDMYFLDLGVDLGVDFIAQSFVREAGMLKRYSRQSRKKWAPDGGSKD
ncbi:MAG: pyruvate kinase [Actinomycetota bacterium]|nr:pyruvate kinase [Actinomycetota bacterium]